MKRVVYECLTDEESYKCRSVGDSWQATCFNLSLPPSLPPS